MAREVWMSKALNYIKEGKLDEGAKLARKELEKDNETPQALWLIANISKSHSERYAALKIYTRMVGVEHIVAAMQRLERYEEQPDLIEKLQSQAPNWSSYKKSTAQKLRSKLPKWLIILSFIGYILWRFNNLETITDFESTLFLLAGLFLVMYLLGSLSSGGGDNSHGSGGDYGDGFDGG